MAKYCPSCGAEVKEGFKFCLSCGAQLQANAVDSKAAEDTVDTGSFEDQVAAQPETGAPVAQPQRPMPPPVMPGQSYGQTQTHAPMQSKKSNSKLIVGIIVAVVAIVVVLLVIFLFMGGGIGFLGGGDLVGTWTMESQTYIPPNVPGAESIPGWGTNTQYSTEVITFQPGGTWESGSEQGTWELSGNKVIVRGSYQSDSPFGDQMGFTYSFSEGGDHLTLTYQYDATNELADLLEQYLGDVSGYDLTVTMRMELSRTS